MYSISELMFQVNLIFINVKIITADCPIISIGII